MIEVTFEDDSSGNGIIFNISEGKKNCSGVIQNINDNLDNNGIQLDDIYINKTGQRLNINRASKIINVQDSKIIQR